MLLYPEEIEQLAGFGAAFTARFEATRQDINALVALTNHVLRDRVCRSVWPSAAAFAAAPAFL